MAYGPPRRVSYPSRLLNLVCKIPKLLRSLPKTNTIGYYIRSAQGGGPFHYDQTLPTIYIALPGCVGQVCPPGRACDPAHSNEGRLAHAGHGGASGGSSHVAQTARSSAVACRRPARRASTSGDA